ncbi:tetratricopeptide repeat protein [Hyphococcus sp.]|uniref:tetratricopeptide repeat protein n=1 Tax=Hyphococcus sp. TaxID=2038636 RepID=UPI0035C6FAD5
MANEDSVILKEVDQALEEDRTWNFFRQHGPALIGAAVVIVAGVAGWQLWNHMRTEQAMEQALDYRNALELLEEDREAGRAALEAVAEENGGYAALASLQEASSYAAGGERLKALEIYRGVASGNAPKRIRELASLRAGYLALADGRDAVMGDVSDIAESGGPFSFYAREMLGVASLSAKDYESAFATFNALSMDLETPSGVRDRAEEFAALAEAGRAGVNISGELKVDDVVRSLGLDAAQDAGPAEETGEGAGNGEEAATEDNAPSDETPSEEMPSDEMIGDASAEDGHDGHDHEE